MCLNPSLVTSALNLRFLFWVPCVLVAESNDIIAPSEIIDLNMPNTRGAHTLFFKDGKTFWHSRTS